MNWKNVRIFIGSKQFMDAGQVTKPKQARKKLVELFSTFSLSPLFSILFPWFIRLFATLSLYQKSFNYNFLLRCVVCNKKRIENGFVADDFQVSLLFHFVFSIIIFVVFVHSQYSYVHNVCSENFLTFSISFFFLAHLCQSFVRFSFWLLMMSSWQHALRENIFSLLSPAPTHFHQFNLYVKQFFTIVQHNTQLYACLPRRIFFFFPFAFASFTFQFFIYSSLRFLRQFSLFRTVVTLFSLSLSEGNPNKSFSFFLLLLEHRIRVGCFE